MVTRQRDLGRACPLDGCAAVAFTGPCRSRSNTCRASSRIAGNARAHSGVARHSSISASSADCANCPNRSGACIAGVTGLSSTTARTRDPYRLRYSIARRVPYEPPTSVSCGYLNATLMASRSSTEAAVVYCEGPGPFVRGAARAHFLDREKLVEVGLRVAPAGRRTGRAAGSSRQCHADRPGRYRAWPERRRAPQLSRRETRSPPDRDLRRDTRRHRRYAAAIDSRRRQTRRCGGRWCGRDARLILVDRETDGIGPRARECPRRPRYSAPSRSGAALGARCAARGEQLHAGRREHGGGERHTGPPSPRAATVGQAALRAISWVLACFRVYFRGSWDAMYFRANSSRCGALTRPTFLPSSSAASVVRPSRRARRIAQNAPTRIAAVQ